MERYILIGNNEWGVVECRSFQVLHLHIRKKYFIFLLYFFLSPSNFSSFSSFNREMEIEKKSFSFLLSQRKRHLKKKRKGEVEKEKEGEECKKLKISGIDFLSYLSQREKFGDKQNF